MRTELASLLYARIVERNGVVLIVTCPTVKLRQCHLDIYSVFKQRHRRRCAKVSAPKRLCTPWKQDLDATDSCAGAKQRTACRPVCCCDPSQQYAASRLLNPNQSSGSPAGLAGRQVQSKPDDTTVGRNLKSRFSIACCSEVLNSPPWVCSIAVCLCCLHGKHCLVRWAV